MYSKNSSFDDRMLYSYIQNNKAGDGKNFIKATKLCIIYYYLI